MGTTNNREVALIKNGQLTEIQISTFLKGLMQCIQACTCPTCGVSPFTLCRRPNGKVVPTHATRVKAGHALMETPIRVVLDGKMEIDLNRNLK